MAAVTWMLELKKKPKPRNSSLSEPIFQFRSYDYLRKLHYNPSYNNVKRLASILIKFKPVVANELTANELSIIVKLGNNLSLRLIPADKLLTARLNTY